MVNAPDISEILNAARTAVAEGERIVEKVREDHNLQPSDDDDGPLMQKWKRHDLVVKATPSIVGEMLINLIAYIVRAEQANRRVVAGVGLARLREHYDGFDRSDLPSDEQSWEAFAIKHLPLPPERVAELIGKVALRGGLLHCAKCWTKVKCECGCGAPYVGEHRWAMGVEVSPVAPEPVKTEPALDRAVAAVTANPEKSNRAIAAEIGVGHQTVGRARKQLEESAGLGPLVGPPDAASDLVLDYDLNQDMHPDAITTEQRWQWSACALFGDLIAARAYWKRQFGDWQKFRPPPELVALMDQASGVMQRLASDLER